MTTTWHPPEPPTQDEHGYDVHPAYGMISAHRVQVTPGSILFGSDIRHNHTIHVTLSRAARKRDLNHDWVHPGQELFDIEMSEAQWASFVSAMNAQGVETTIRRVPGDWNVPGVEHKPRLALSMAETTSAADKAWEQIRDAFATYKARPTKGNLRSLEACIDNATANVAYAGETLVKHAENVVQKARADVEAMVTAHAQRLGIDPADTVEALQIEA